MVVFLSGMFLRLFLVSFSRDFPCVDAQHHRRRSILSSTSINLSSDLSTKDTVCATKYSYLVIALATSTDHEHFEVALSSKY